MRVSGLTTIAPVRHPWRFIVGPPPLPSREMVLRGETARNTQIPHEIVFGERLLYHLSVL
jgi:hypothetical protein